MSSTAKERPRRRCSVASNSGGFYTEYENKENNYVGEHNTPSDTGSTDSNIDSNSMLGARRSARKITPCKKYDKEFEVSNLSRWEKTRRKFNSSNGSETTDSEEEKVVEASRDRAYATNSFEDLVDIEGKQIVGFNTPRKRDEMDLKALGTPKKIKTNVNSTKKREKQDIKTPTIDQHKTADKKSETGLTDSHFESNSPPSNARRSTRKITPCKRYCQEFEVSSPSRQESTPRKFKRTKRDESSESEEDDGFTASSDTVHKAVNLFEDLLDVEGKQIFGFNTPKKRDGMAMKALSTPNRPKTNPDSTKKREKQEAKSNSKKILKEELQSRTPRHIRNRVKAEISKLLLDSSDSDFSVDESDYEPNKESSEDEEIEENTSDDGGIDEESEKLNEKLLKYRQQISKTISISSSSTKRRAAAKKTEEFVPESDGYFTTHSSKKITTSDHTLDRLKNPRLPHNQLFSLLASMKLSSEHEHCLTTLLDDYKTHFGKWLHILNEGYNILLYGLGSKRNLLQIFHKEMLPKYPVIVVNGFFPSLTVKDILDGITYDVLGITSTSGNLHEVVDIIGIEFSKIPQTHLFLIVHNIDGTMLRNGKAQDLLSRLATVPNIHLLASIDHINTPLLWDHSKLSNYNFSWWDVTTMLPYDDETAFENSLLVQNSGNLALSSMNNVFQSLTTNARKIYMLIVKKQLKSKENQNYQGLPFKDLYWLCRESFLVSSDLALRAQLTEFLDHKLVKSKRAVDGIEYLSIPIATSLLQQFVDQQN